MIRSFLFSQKTGVSAIKRCGLLSTISTEASCKIASISPDQPEKKKKRIVRFFLHHLSSPNMFLILSKNVLRLA